MSSISDTPIFRLAAEIASKDLSSFKRAVNLRTIFEHVSYEHGLNYWHEIKKDKLFNEIDKYLINDTIGHPWVFEYEGRQVSPSTLRYIYFLKLIKDRFDLTGSSIVEIGGGYGGLCLILSRYFNFGHYTIIDLKQINKLQQAYLWKFGLDNVSFYDNEQTYHIQNFSSDEIDLCISTFAFSECHKETREFYIENVINKSKHLFLVCDNNMFSTNELSHIDGLKIEPLLTEKPWEINLITK